MSLRIAFLWAFLALSTSYIVSTRLNTTLSKVEDGETVWVCKEAQV